jgi:hypothetical protein
MPLSLMATLTLFISSRTPPTPHINSKNGAPLELNTTINASRAIFDLDANDDHTTKQDINNQLGNTKDINNQAGRSTTTSSSTTSTTSSHLARRSI